MDLCLLLLLLLVLPQDYNHALRYFRKAAEKNNGLGLYGLGYMYLSGTAVLQDYDTAFKKLQAAADAGDRDAHFYLGTMYYNVSSGGAAACDKWSAVSGCWDVGVGVEVRAENLCEQWVVGWMMLQHMMLQLGRWQASMAKVRSHHMLCAATWYTPRQVASWCLRH